MIAPANPVLTRLIFHDVHPLTLRLMLYPLVQRQTLS
jgi:hypothetical protein